MKHPVLQHDLDARRGTELERAVARVMAMPEPEMLALVPTRSGILFCGCPNCSGGQQENGQFHWSIEKPRELRCKYCEHVYPSEKYPERWTATGKNALGETVSYPYYFDEKAGRDYWLEAAADYFRRHWFVSQCLALARAYHVTRKPEYARRAALILDRFAQAYPHMAVLSQWPYRRRGVASPTPPYPSAGGKWGRWAEDEIPHNLPEAYDLIHDSEEMDRLSKEQGIDVRRRIENDFFRATVEYTLTFGKEPTGRHLNNMAPFYTGGMIRIGRVICEPAYVHWGYRWVHEILRDRFFYDGMWCEAPSYHYQTIGGIRQVTAALKGYSDPPGYEGAGGLRLENLDLDANLPLVRKALHAPDLIAYPNGSICPVHDTWARSRSSRAREESTPALLPGFGHASLGNGRGDRQTVAQLHFSGGYGHDHGDNLNLSLFALGRELLCDLGYTHTKLRHWTVSTFGHNTVAVDGQEQSTRNSEGDLTLFAAGPGGLCAVEARGERAYPGKAEVYRRAVVLVPLPDGGSYVVDLFRVQGGRRHDWLLHGSADTEMAAECVPALSPWEGSLLEAGQKWVEPIGESSSFPPYGLLREIRRGAVEGAAAVTLRCTGADTANAPAGVRVQLLGAGDLFLAKSPRVRPGEGDDRKVLDYWMPQLIFRREGAAPLSSLFVAVHEPFGAQPALAQVRALPVEPAGDACAAVEVEHGEFTDTIVAVLDEAPYPERRLPGGLVVQGRLAVVRERAGQVVSAWLVDGRRAGKGKFSLALEKPRYEGALTGAERTADGAPADAFLTDAALPAGEALAGRWMVVTHADGHTHGYQVERVERRGGLSAIVLTDDHGLKVAERETEEMFFPRRRFAGANRFVIAGQAAWM